MTSVGIWGHSCPGLFPLHPSLEEAFYSTGAERLETPHGSFSFGVVSLNLEWKMKTPAQRCF